MDLTVKEITYSSCGHINVFLGDGRQVTVHKKDLLDYTIDVPPEIKDLVETEILKLFIKLRMRPILINPTLTLAQKWATIQTAVAKGVTLWE
jgi:hypothetical protein